MSHLVLELRPGETMILNGASIRFRTKCRVELVSQARFLFGKQIMAAHEAATATRRLYYQLQIAYVGPVEDRVETCTEISKTFVHLKAELPTSVIELLNRAEKAFVDGDFYQALKLVRKLIQEEDSIASAS